MVDGLYLSPNNGKIMKTLTQQEIEEFKQHRWFIMHNNKNCSICGKEFDFNENSYYGHLDDGTYAYTCEKCSQQMTDAEVYTNSHRHSYSIPVSNAKLWRYMDLAKFLSLLEYNSLFFTRIDHFQDPFEGALGIKKNEELWSTKEQEWKKKWIEIRNNSNNICLCDSELQLLAEQEFKKYRKNIKEWRTKNYVNCWHQSDCESEAMWQLYTRDCNEGIAIQTTFERLYQALPSVPQPSFGMVNYINFNEYNNGGTEKNFHPFEAVWYKRESFAHEKEFRIVIEDIGENDFHDRNKKIRVDLNLLIENIYISPKADKWFTELVKDIIKNRYKLWINVKQSELNEQPFF